MASSTRVLVAEGRDGLLKLFWRATLALVAEQSRGVWAGTEELNEADAYSASNSLRRYLIVIYSLYQHCAEAQELNEPDANTAGRHASNSLRRVI